MYEATFFLDTPDGAKVKVIASKISKDSATRRAVLIGHGLTGNPNEHLHLVARDAFVAGGYDVYRMAFYDFAEGARNIIDCTLEVHARDFMTVFEHLEGVYPSVYAAGHSYGGLTLLYAQPDRAKALAFWDPAFTAGWLSAARRIEALGCYAVDWNGVTRLLGAPMYEEAKALTADDAGAKAARIKAPSLVVVSGEAPRARGRVHDHLACRKELVEISEADHSFTLGDTAKTLAEVTLQWFNRFP